MCLLPIDFDFLHNGKISFEIFLNEVSYFLRSTILLSEELIAGKCDDLESFFIPAIMGFDHFHVVLRGETSLASYVDDHYKFFILEGVEVELFTVDIVDFKVKEGFRKGRLQTLGAGFED